MLYKSICICFLLVLTLLGCKSNKKAVTPKPNKTTTRVVIPPKKEISPIAKNKKTVVTTPNKTKPANSGNYADVVTNYILLYSDLAKEEMAKYGIPASITLAQGVLESGAGQGDLSKRANNHFGIKCHSSWEGERVYHDDDKDQECFRKYVDPKYSYRDHSLFLSQRSRYKDLFSLSKTDYKGWARGLKRAGYATDPKYPNKLIRIIERYNLQSYDLEVLQNTDNSITSTTVSNTIVTMETYTVKKGDTLYGLSRKFNISVASLKQYNGLTDNSLSIGQVLYLTSK